MDTRYLLPLILALGVVLCSCSSLNPLKKPDDSKPAKEEKTLVIPVCSTAQEQYAYASMYKRRQVVISEPKRRAEQTRRIAECYEKVVGSFPDDATYTPVAYLELGDCAARVEDHRKALEYYDLARQKYSGNEYVQCRSLLSKARIYDRQGRFEDAKVIYKDIMDGYSGSNNAAVRDLAKKAEGGYYQLRQKPKKAL